MLPSSRCLNVLATISFLSWLLASPQARAQSPDPAAPRDLMLEVFVNGNDTQKVAAFHQQDGHLYTAATELAAIGITLPAGADVGHIDITEVRGLSYVLDDRDQSLHLQLPVRSLSGHVLGIPRMAATVSASPPGALIDYDATAIAHNGRIDLYGYGSARLFGSFGTIQNDATVRRLGGSTHLTRLSTTYS